MFRLRTIALAGAMLSTAAAATLTILHQRPSEASPLPAQPRSKILGLDLQPQRMGNWCWAASGQMVMDFGDRSEGQDISQCTQARFRVEQLIALVGGTDPPPNCCSQPVDCNRTGWPIFDSFEFQSRNTASEPQSWLPWETIVAEIDAERPICFSIKWTGVGERGGHMGVIHGYEETADGERFLHIMDPWPVPQPQSDIPELQRGGTPWRLAYDHYVRFDDVSEGPEAQERGIPFHWKQHRHWRDYYEIRPIPQENGPNGPE
ncbi:papain-like cysteine protease family protein [Tautonia sp. JC769]|uniref:papain-like cysteine protease family protein n=1 Tax=Tautonia sp. JC769 TaxID=3232135 RepID=UPI0034586B43